MIADREHGGGGVSPWAAGSGAGAGTRGAQGDEEYAASGEAAETWPKWAICLSEAVGTIGFSDCDDRL